MKVNSSNVKKIKKDASEKGDLCAGVLLEWKIYLVLQN